MRSQPVILRYMPDSNLTRLTQKNLVHIIKSSIGSDMFRHTYVKHIDGREFDALDDGDKACAYHTSGVLSLVDLIDKPHATVDTTIKMMLEAGWFETDKPVAGSVVLWPATNEYLAHTGFFIDESTYISNSSNDKHPIKHGRQMIDGREPEKYFTHPKLVNS